MANRNTDYLPLSEAAKVFDVKADYIQELIDAKAIRGKKKDGNVFVQVNQLNEYLRKKAELEDARKPNRIQEMEEKVNQTNSLVRTIGLLFSDAIDSIAELGSLIPIIELLVTAVAFYGAGLNEVAPGLHIQGADTIPIPSIPSPALGADPGKKIGKGIVLVVGPFFEGVVVALGAIDG